MPPGISLPALPRPVAICCSQLSAAQAGSPSTAMPNTAMIVERKLIGDLLVYAQPASTPGLWSPFRLLQRALIGDLLPASKLRALPRHPDLVAARQAGTAGQAQFVLLHAPGTGTGLAERKGLRAPIRGEDVAPMH